MPIYLSELGWIRDIFPLLVFAFLWSSLVYCLMPTFPEFKRYIWPSSHSSTTQHLFLVVFSISFLGIATGLITGNSRESAVGTVLPAILSILGGVTVYLFGTKGEKEQIIVGCSIICLTMNLLIGIYWGSTMREEKKVSEIIQKRLEELDYVAHQYQLENRKRKWEARLLEDEKIVREPEELRE